MHLDSTSQFLALFVVKGSFGIEYPLIVAIFRAFGVPHDRFFLPNKLAQQYQLLAPPTDFVCPRYGSAELDEVRADTLKSAPGSRHRHKRKGRGIAAGQGASCGFGMRGQKSRSGPSVRAGFEGGQTALYRRLPKMVGTPMGPGHTKKVHGREISVAYNDGVSCSRLKHACFRGPGLMHWRPRFRTRPLSKRKIYRSRFFSTMMVSLY